MAKRRIPEVLRCLAAGSLEGRETITIPKDVDVEVVIGVGERWLGWTFCQMRIGLIVNEKMLPSDKLMENTHL